MTQNVGTKSAFKIFPLYQKRHVPKF